MNEDQTGAPDIGALYVQQLQQEGGTTTTTDTGEASGSGAATPPDTTPTQTEGAGEGAAAKPTAKSKGSEAGEDYNAILEKITEGRVKSPDELKSYFDRPDLTKFPSLKARLDFYETHGEDEEKFSKFMQTDPTKLTDEQKVKFKMQRDYPSASADDIEFLFKEQYKLDEDEYDESEVRKSKILLREAAAGADKLLQEERSKYSVPDVRAQREQAYQQIQQAVQSTIADFNHVEVPGEGGDKFKIAVSKEDKAMIAELAPKLADVNLWAKAATGADGKFSWNQLYERMYLALKGPDAFIHASKAAATKGAQNYRDQRITNSDSFSGSGSNNSGTGQTVKTMDDYFLESMKANGLA